MTICLKCHRPLKRPTESGYGRVCEKLAQPAPEVSRDLFGFDIDAAVLAAQERLAEFIAVRYAVARYEIRYSFLAARVKLRGWP